MITFKNPGQNRTYLAKVHKSTVMICMLWVFSIISIENAKATNYYPVNSAAARAALQTASNWTTNADGSVGSTPTFTAAGNVYFIYNVPNVATSFAIAGTLSISGSGSKIVVGDGTNAITFSQGTSSFTATVDVANNATLDYSTSTGTLTLGTLATGSTVKYSRASSQTIISATYSNLTIGGTSGAKTTGGSVTVNGAFLITSDGGTMTIANGHTVTINGTFSNNKTTSIAAGSGAGSGILQFSSTANLPAGIGSGGTFSTSDPINITANANLNVTAATTIKALVINSGDSVTISSGITLTEAGSLTNNGGSGTNRGLVGPGTLSFSATATVSGTGSFSTTNPINLNVGASVTIGISVTVRDLTVASSNTLTLNTPNVVTVQGNLTCSSTGDIAGTGSITMTGTGVTLAVGSGSIAPAITISSSVTVTDGFTLTGGLTVNAGATLTINSALVVGDGSTAKILQCDGTIAGSSSLTLAGGSSLANAIVIKGGTSGTHGQINVTTFNIVGNSASRFATVDATAFIDCGASTAVNGTNSGGTLTNNGNLTINGTFPMTTQTSYKLVNNLKLTCGAVSNTGSSASINNNSPGTFTCTSLSSSATFNNNSGGIFIATGTITVTNGTFTNDGSLTAAGITTSSTFNNNANGIINCSGTIAISGSNTLTNTGQVFSTGSGGITGTSSSGSKWTNAASSYLELVGPMLSTGTLTATATDNTIKYNGTAADQDVKGTTYYDLALDKGSTTANIVAATTVSHNFTLTSGIVSIGNFTLTLNGGAGSVTCSGTITNPPGTSFSQITIGSTTGDVGTLRFSGAAPQIAGLQINQNTTSANTTSVTLGTDLTVGILNFNSSNPMNGVIQTGSNTLTVTGSITGSPDATHGWVVGNLQRSIPQNATTLNRLFPIGTNAAYAPVTLVSITTDNNGPVSVLARTDVGTPTNGDPSFIVQSARCPNYWTLTKSGAGNITSYNPQFDYTNLSNTGTVANYKLAKYPHPSGWGVTNGVVTGTTITATGLTSMSEFEIGEPITHTITASAGSNGTITPSGALSVVESTDNSFIFTADPCYHIDDVLVDGVSNAGAVSAGSYTFTNVTTDHTIAVTFAANGTTFDITASVTGGTGTITPSGVTTKNCGESQDYIITPDPCYTLTDVKIDGITNAGAITAGSYSFTSIQANHTIDVTFTIKTYTIAVTQTANGTITPDPSGSINCGDDFSFTIAPDAGYAIQNVITDAGSQGAVGTYTFTNVNAAGHTITAVFTNSNHTITATTGSNGSISPSGTVTVVDLANQSFSFTPDPCYQINDVLVDGVSNSGAITAGSYTFSSVTTDHTIDVQFVLGDPIITASAGVGGSISLSGATTVTCGNDQPYTITPSSACYFIQNVLVDGVSNAGAISSGTYTFTNVQNNHTISVVFGINYAPLPTVTSLSTTTFCNGGSVILSADGAPTYSWSTGETTTTITVETEGRFTVSSASGLGNNGCPIGGPSTPVVTTVHANPTAIITGDDHYCEGGSNTLSAATSVAGCGTIPSNGYQWYHNNTLIGSANASTYNATAPGSYKVVVTNSCGCSSTTCTP